MLTQQQRYRGLSARQTRLASQLEAALKSRHLEEAARTCRALVAQAGGHPEVLRLQGVLAFLQGNAAGALEALVAALQMHPQDALVHTYLGASYERLGDNDNALKAFRLACEQAPDNIANWLNFGRALIRGGWYEHAAAIVDHAVKLAPANRDARIMLASALTLHGNGPAAAAQYRRLLVDAPATGLAWWGLALLKPMSLDGDDIVHMQALLDEADIDAANRVAMHFALAHAMERADDHVGAFEHLQRAHALASRQRQPWDGMASRALTQRCLDASPAPPPAQPNDPGREVIFIVSLPRSGSTLVEQILSSHSQVAGTVELGDLGQVLSDYSEQRAAAYPDWISSLSTRDWHGLGQQYLARTARWRKGRPRMTDKMPGNWRHIGAILSMLPNARVVVVRRDPLETCLACYRMLLDGHDYTHDLADLAEFQRQFDGAVHEWQRRCPQRVRIQNYEALTREPESQIRELLNFCDLPFEQACVEFHMTQRRVSTLSAAQVREPMRRDTARAERYGALLDPLREALQKPAWQPAHC